MNCDDTYGPGAGRILARSLRGPVQPARIEADACANEHHAEAVLPAVLPPQPGNPIGDTHRETAPDVSECQEITEAGTHVVCGRGAVFLRQRQGRSLEPDRDIEGGESERQCRERRDGGVDRATGDNEAGEARCRDGDDQDMQRFWRLILHRVPGI